MILHHVLLTRFNLPTRGYEGFIRATPHWLEERFQLFERYCLPSVAAQTCKNFNWIIYFDPETPNWAKAKLTEHVKQGYYRALFREEVPKPRLLADIQECFGSAAPMLLTSSLDNDDMIALDFIARLQDAAAAGSQCRTVLNFPLGFTYAKGCFFYHEDRSNAFASMYEPEDGALTIWHDWHTRLKLHAPIIQLGGDPAWVQVIHGRNVSNRVRGWLVDPIGTAQQFPVPPSEIVGQTAATLLEDRLLHWFFRQPREFTRRIARTVVAAVLSREALGAVKLYISRVRKVLSGRG